MNVAQIQVNFKCESQTLKGKGRFYGTFLVGLLMNEIRSFNQVLDVANAQHAHLKSFIRLSINSIIS